MYLHALILQMDGGVPVSLEPWGFLSDFYHLLQVTFPESKEFWIIRVREEINTLVQYGLHHTEECW